MAALGVKIDANPLHRSDTWKLSLARLVFADSMTRMALLPPKGPAESISILRKVFDALSRDQDFLEDSITVYSRASNSAKRENAYSSSPLGPARK